MDQPPLTEKKPLKKVYIDCETTGKNPLTCGLIQFSMYVSINGVIQDNPLNLKIQPFSGDVFEKDAMEMHGLTEEGCFDVFERLDPVVAYQTIVAELAKYVDKFNKSDKFHFVGFRASFDSDVIREFFRKNGDEYFGSWFWTPVVCLMILAGVFLMRARHKMLNFKLRTVWETLHPEKKHLYSETDWHDAMFDIERTIDIETSIRAIMLRGSIPPEVKKLIEA